jgi:hypothetical protein
VVLDGKVASITHRMPRTTLNLDPLVMRELRQRSKRERKSMGDLASQLLARALRGDEPPSPPPAFDWVSRDLGTPTVDLEDKEALNARLEQGG